MNLNLPNHLWQSTVFAACVALMAWVLRNHRASIRYALWFSASVKFLVPFALFISLGKQAEPALAPLASFTPPVALATEQFATPFPEAILSGAASKQIDWMPWILALWGCGLLTITTMRLIAWFRVRAIVRASRPHSMQFPVPVRISSGVLGPGLVGLWRCTILLPEEIESHLTCEQLDAVLAHELCHARRRDNLTAAIHMAVEALFWFHPLVWWIGARLTETRELSCDEAVLAGGGNAQEYAQAILAVCKRYVEPPLACVSGVTGADLKKRMEAILASRVMLPLSWSKRMLLATAASIALLVPFLAGVLSAQTSKLFDVGSIHPLPPYAFIPASFGGGELSKLTRSVAQKVPNAEMHAEGTLSFDVASVRPSNETKQSSNVPLGPGGIYSPSHGILSAKNFRLITYLVFAYKLADYQQDALESTAPYWVLHDRYSIEAHTEKLDVTKDEMRLMMRSLLAERFKLAVHEEKRQMPVFALVMAKASSLGPKLQAHPAGATCSDPYLKSTSTDGKPVELPLQPQKGGFPAVCNGILGLPASAQDRWSFGGSGVSMSLIASSLSGFGNLGRPVVDQTGLAGIYDFVLDYTPDPRPSYATEDSGGPGFQEALKQQLGLKLEAQRAPVELLMLDHVERPGEN